MCWKRTTYNIPDTRVGAANENGNAHDKDGGVDDALVEVGPLVPWTLLEEHEPHQRGEVKSEPGDEERRGERQEVVEEGDDLGDDKGNHGDDGDQDQP